MYIVVSETMILIICLSRDKCIVLFRDFQSRVTRSQNLITPSNLIIRTFKISVNAPELIISCHLEYSEDYYLITKSSKYIL